MDKIQEHDHYHLFVDLLKRKTPYECIAHHTVQQKTYTFKAHHKIRLQGNRLKETGFSIGDNIQVVCKKNRLVIAKAMENVG